MKKKRKSWPRWAKILRNLLLALLLGVMIWDLWDQPSFSCTMALRRRERQMLLPEPEAAVEFKVSEHVKYRIELADDIAITSHLYRGDFFAVANPSVRYLEEGPNLLIVPLAVERRDEFGQPLSHAAYAAVHPPENAAAAMLTLRADDASCAVEGIREGEFFLFYARPEPDENGHIAVNSSWLSPEELHYELEFLDGDGNSICRVSG